MLQAIRERAQGWIAYAIVGMISIPFALWGVNSYFSEGGSQNVIVVNDREIGQAEFRNAYANQRAALQQMMGENFRPDLIDEGRLREQVVQGLIDEEVVIQSAQSRGFRVGDQQVAQVIQREQTFQRDGKFDRALFDIYLRNQGETTESFGYRLKRVMLRSQIEGGLRASSFVVDKELLRIAQLRNQRRSAEYVVIPVTRFRDQKPSEEAIKKYYETHLSRFVTPQRVKIEYLELKLDDIAANMVPEEALLKQRYEEQIARFGRPEDRKVSHILITLEGRSDAEAKEKALALRERILKGESFEELAKTESEDPGSASQGGDLGFIGRGIMDPEFERAAYALGLSDISEPVRTTFGYHLLMVTAVKPGSTKPFEEVRDELVKEIQREMAENRFFEQSEILANSAYEHPDTLSVAAEQLGLSIKESDWFDAKGGEGIAEYSQVVQAAFSEDVLELGNNSEPLEISADHLVVLRVIDRQPSRQQTLEEVRDTIVERLRNETAAQRTAELGARILARLKEGESLQSIARDEGLEVLKVDKIQRDSGDLPGELRQLLFKLPKPASDKLAWGGTALASGDYGVVVLREIADGEQNLSEEEKTALKQALLQAEGQELVRSNVASLRAKAEITINRDAF
ncbi:MAG: SurA N-terminal domain-containing protein [Gammaproteobacteria bacterium]